MLTRGAAVGLTCGVAALGLAADQASKALALQHLQPGRPVPVLGSFFQLMLAFNPGAAFSLGESATWLFTLLAVAVLVGVGALVVPRVRTRGWAVVLGMFLAGVAGNLVDRLLRPPAPFRGHVVDFLYLTHWPIFNVADSLICVAAVAVAAMSFWGTVGIDGRPVDKEES